MGTFVPASRDAWNRALCEALPDLDRPLLRFISLMISGTACADVLASLDGSTQERALEAGVRGPTDHSVQLKLLSDILASERARCIYGSDVAADLYLHAVFGMLTPRPLDVRVPQVAAYLADPAKWIKVRSKVAPRACKDRAS